MVKLDMYWMSNDDWYTVREIGENQYEYKIKPDAPPEVKRSFERYMEQGEK